MALCVVTYRTRARLLLCYFLTNHILSDKKKNNYLSIHTFQSPISPYDLNLVVLLYDISYKFKPRKCRCLIVSLFSKINRLFSKTDCFYQSKRSGMKNQAKNIRIHLYSEFLSLEVFKFLGLEILIFLIKILNRFSVSILLLY